MAPAAKILNLKTINPNILATKYAVRGELAIKADQITRELSKDSSRFPFKKVTYCNIGNPQQLGQKPITFFRQVLALLENQEWLKDDGKLCKLRELYASDAIKRAQTISQSCPAVGAYSGSNGLFPVRAAVAEFIERRDGYPSHPDSIYLTNGASEGIARVLNAIVAHPDVGVLVPIPQYPLYTGTLAMLNAHAVPYYLDESEEWSLPAAELRRAISAGREKGIDVRALVLINPGNPTGSVLTRSCLREVIHICAEERLVLLADEVYQDNVYDVEGKPFVSAKEVVCELGLQESLELVSFHSTSKGLLGECGRRGGYFECSGLDKAVMEQLFKVASVSLCSNILGQLMVGLMVDPPRPGDESHSLYEAERNAIWTSLKRRAERLQHVFNTQMRGVSCQPAHGAMYLFPKFDFPPRMIEAAASAGKLPDEFYALELLDATGVCVVPGSGFGQLEGTYHVRTTFLPDESEFDAFCQLIVNFHDEFYYRFE